MRGNVMPAMKNDFERAEKTLHGILVGIKADKCIELEELRHLKEWLELHKNLSHKLPFCEIYEMVERILEDGVIDEFEHEELMQYINNYDSENSPLMGLNEEMRILHGFIQGVGVDKIITAYELKALKKWMLYHEEIIDKWPFDELYKHIENILQDGIVTADEQKELFNFINNFSDKKASQQIYDESVFVNKWMETTAPSVETVKSVIDKDCKITIEGKSVCITGLMKVKRGTVLDIIKERGGIPKNDISLKLNYLVIGALSNPCWQYTNYGRKIEKAMEFNKKGSQINIVSENDFLVALNS
jgi:NAD-dependent DNA ligase